MLSDWELSQAGHAESLYFHKPLTESCKHSHFPFNSKEPPSQELKSVSKVNLGRWQKCNYYYSNLFPRSSSPPVEKCGQLTCFFFPPGLFFSPGSPWCHLREDRVAFSCPLATLSTAQHLLLAVEAHSLPNGQLDVWEQRMSILNQTTQLNPVIPQREQKSVSTLPFSFVGLQKDNFWFVLVALLKWKVTSAAFTNLDFFCNLLGL